MILKEDAQILININAVDNTLTLNIINGKATQKARDYLAGQPDNTTAAAIHAAK